MTEQTPTTPPAEARAGALTRQLEQYLALPGIAVVRAAIPPHQEGYNASHWLIVLDQTRDTEEQARVLTHETVSFVVDHLLPELSLPEAEIVADGAAQMVLSHVAIIEESEYRQWTHENVDALGPHIGQIHRMAHRILSGIAAQEERP